MLSFAWILIFPFLTVFISREFLESEVSELALLLLGQNVHPEEQNIHSEGRNDILEGVDKIIPRSTLSGPADNTNDAKD